MPISGMLITLFFSIEWCKIITVKKFLRSNRILSLLIGHIMDTPLITFRSHNLPPSVLTATISLRHHKIKILCFVYYSMWLWLRINKRWSNVNEFFFSSWLQWNIFVHVLTGKYKHTCSVWNPYRIFYQVLEKKKKSK